MAGRTMQMPLLIRPFIDRATRCHGDDSCFPG